MGFQPHSLDCFDFRNLPGGAKLVQSFSGSHGLHRIRYRGKHPHRYHHYARIHPSSKSLGCKIIKLALIILEQTIPPGFAVDLPAARGTRLLSTRVRIHSSALVHPELRRF